LNYFSSFFYILAQLHRIENVLTNFLTHHRKNGSFYH